MNEPIELDAERIFEILNRHQVRYVVIGGFAALLHGLPRTTQDVDITPAPDRENLDRLSAALVDLEAQLLPPDSEPIAWPWSSESLRPFTFVTTRTRHGTSTCASGPTDPVADPRPSSSWRLRRSSSS